MAKQIRIKPILLTVCFILGLSLLSVDTITFTKPSNISEQSKSAASTSSTSAAIEKSTSTNTDIPFKEEETLKSPQNDSRLVATSRGSDARENEKEIKESKVAEKRSDPAAVAVAPAVTAAPEPKPAVTEKAVTATAEISKDTSAELDLLARLITAEAQAEPYEAQVAVGAAVLNRVESSDWPNTIYGVIYQNINGYVQFTPVENGWIDKPAQPESIKAAKAALSGVDPTNGAEFYYDDTTTNTWILSKPVSIQIGHMIYAY